MIYIYIHTHHHSCHCKSNTFPSWEKYQQRRFENIREKIEKEEEEEEECAEYLYYIYILVNTKYNCCEITTPKGVCDINTINKIQNKNHYNYELALFPLPIYSKFRICCHFSNVVSYRYKKIKINDAM
jgi:hypothetical protein